MKRRKGENTSPLMLKIEPQRWGTQVIFPPAPEVMSEVNDLQFQKFFIYGWIIFKNTYKQNMKSLGLTEPKQTPFYVKNIKLRAPFCSSWSQNFIFNISYQGELLRRLKWLLFKPKKYQPSLCHGRVTVLPCTKKNNELIYLLDHYD